MLEIRCLIPRAVLQLKFGKLHFQSPRVDTRPQFHQPRVDKRNTFDLKRTET